jgi:nucleoside-diphosphate-sugar epimerase
MLFQAAARGLLPVPAGRSRIQIIFAEQAALAISRAAGRSDLDRRTPFLCDPEPVAIKELCGAMARLSGRAVRLLPVPDLALWLTGAFETLCEALTRRSLPFNADKAREILAGDWLCDGAPLRRELDLPPPTPLEDGLAQTWQWYKERGWLAL